MNCMGCLRDQEHQGYCRKCRKELFDGRKVQHILPYCSPGDYASDVYIDMVRNISLPGDQAKYSLKLQDKDLTLANEGGTYILKPAPVDSCENPDQVPANEHLTMQIARQVFGISVPPNALIDFNDDSAAYLVKRFDINHGGHRFQQEDFAQIAQMTDKTHGRNYKYLLSYEELGVLIRKYIPTYKLEVERFFRLVLFNYVFSNDGAHIRNFSIIQLETGDYVLTPAYDLLCTRIHAGGESDLALNLFKDYHSQSFLTQGFYTHHDFFLLGKRLGIKDSRVSKIINEFRSNDDKVVALIERSFLKGAVKEIYKELY